MGLKCDMKEFQHCSLMLFDFSSDSICDRSVVVIGPPCVGKTTLINYFAVGQTFLSPLFHICIKLFHCLSLCLFTFHFLVGFELGAYYSQKQPPLEPGEKEKDAV